jgi:DNA-binding transcriptional ArsR family regulator
LLLVEVAIIYNQMVVDERRDEAVDELFRALADPTRRDILRRCAAGEPSVSRLAQAYPMSFAAVQKQLVHTDAGAVDRARQALDELESIWRGRVDRMSDLLR